MTKQVTLREKMEQLVTAGNYSKIKSDYYSVPVPKIRSSALAESRRHLYNQKKSSYPHMPEEKLVEYANSFILFVSKSDLQQA